jgi:acyl carrier protein
MGELIEETIARLEQYIAAKVLKQPGKGIGADESLIRGGLIDSFSLVDLALFVEDTFGVRLDDTELNADVFDTLQELASLIEARRAR